MRTGSFIYIHAPMWGHDHLQGRKAFKGGFSLRFLAPVRRFLTKKCVSLARSLVKRAGPKVMKTVLSTGADLMSGKDVKKTLKKGL